MTATVTKPASGAVGLAPAIFEAQFTAIEAPVQMNPFDIDPAYYAGIKRGIINKILKDMNMAKEIDSL